MSTPMTWPVGPDLLGREEAIESGTTAEIDDDFARAHRRYRQGIAAAEPEVGTFGNGTQLGLRVTHSQSFILESRGWLGAAARRCGRATTG
jgi:hypothetical protein